MEFWGLDCERQFTDSVASLPFFPIRIKRHL
jgi:hypothetical protein